MSCCTICKESKKKGLSVASDESFKKMKDYAKKWSVVGEYTKLWEWFRDKAYSDGIMYHRTCYQRLCNKTMLSRKQDKIPCSSKNLLKRRNEENNRLYEKKRKTFDEMLCVFCQISSPNELHNVCTETMGKTFLDIKEKSLNKNTQARLAFLFHKKDAFAQNMKYHRTCLRNETKLIEKYKPNQEKNEENILSMRTRNFVMSEYATDESTEETMKKVL